MPAGERLNGLPHSHAGYEETIYGLTGVLTWTVDGAALALAACGPDSGPSPLEPPATPKSAVDNGAAASAARAVESPFRGTVDAVETMTLLPGTGTALVHLVGEDTATRLGRYTLVADITVTLATLAGAGTLTLTAANGDVLAGTVTGQVTPAGGTGRFAGATGRFTLERALTFATGVSAGSFEGTITRSR